MLRVVDRHGSNALQAARPRRQDRLEPFHGARMYALGPGLFGDPQDLRRLGAAELLEVSQAQPPPGQGGRARSGLPGPGAPARPALPRGRATSAGPSSIEASAAELAWGKGSR